MQSIMHDFIIESTRVGNYNIITLILFIVSLLITLVSTPLMRLIASRLEIIDKPDSKVKTHTVATPYMGGLAMLIGLITTAIIGASYLDLLNEQFLAILIGMVFLAVIGFVDDLFTLKPLTRFIGQIAVSLLMIKSGIHLEIVYLSEWQNYALTIIWIVGITNALNIIDIMDGLAAGVTVIAAATFLFVAIPKQQVFVFLLSAPLIGAALGFWVFNFFDFFKKKIKIYMGDSGAYLLGFSLAIIAIVAEFTAENELALLSPILILGLPIYDTFLVMFLRSVAWKNPFHGSKDHFALRLEASGIPRRYVVILIYHICVILGQTAFIATLLNFWGALFAYCLITLIALVAGLKLGWNPME